ncbi:uncharacterized protein EAF01_008742 [Botrytis porri]|uniref:Ubiquitin-like domain-containing protein n=1 Tax=Botrytis porri TaxID=87229 RepID=A0A4Z1K661_9HELO|nr:uncharacterized protein EAF01_008742 [Botrytis porri]KAF7897776.1 hypothetical protein EAF01_008742 [Botrytis porri]TGO81148.1 hypothetical protein BPOR_1318g00010 [Botrytis porri]
MHSPTPDPQTPIPASREHKPQPGASSGADTGKPKTVSVTVKDQLGDEITFKIKRNKPMSKIMEAYCQHKEIGDIQSVRFLYDGLRIEKEHTADSLEMDVEARLDVFLEQLGGAR